MPMPGRNLNTNQYRYGFNGKENINEAEGNGNWQDYGERMYSTRLGRFPSPYPLIVYKQQYPELSSYQFASNTPIWGIDQDGEEVRIYTEEGNYLKANVGHTFISVGKGKDIIVYTYGRYDDVDKNKGLLNGTNLTGEGVLIKLTGQEAQDYIDIATSQNGAKIFELTDISKSEEKNVIKHLDKQFNSSQELPDNPKSKYYKDENARLVDQYDLLENNCTTKSSEAVIQGGTNAFNIDENTIITPRTPTSMQNFLEVKSQESKPLVIEIEKPSGGGGSW